MVSVLTNRIEDLPALVPAESVDLMTVRAVRLDDAVRGAISTLLRQSGRLLLFGASNAELHGFSILEARPLAKPGNIVRLLAKR
jgi:hypothetical protein